MIPNILTAQVPYKEMVNKNTFYSIKQTQGEHDPPNFDTFFTERFLLPRKVKKCEIKHFRKTGMGRLRHLRRLRRFSPTYSYTYL